ncbi:MAG: type II secretion system F family protein, partial [Thiobacillaceae bacterium]
VADRLRRHGSAAVAVGAPSTASSALLLEKDYSKIGPLDRALKRSSLAERIALDLARAGVPLRVGEYVLIRWLVGAALFTFIGFVLGWHLITALALGVLGFYLPRFYVKRQEGKRIKKFEDQLVDALTMMANSLKSGSSFLQAIDMVARELPDPISNEFSRVVAEANVGASVETSLLDLAERVRSYDLYLVVTAMLVQREVGGNLAEVLENIAHTIRERLRILRQVQVETAQQRISGYIIGALPIIVMIGMLILNPIYPEILLHTGIGQIILVGLGVMELLGFLIIRRIVDIEV